ncbi:MAG: flagellar biosynthetic protein FliQ [Oscillospiraceae bacterium]|nr:flagellar biosynthetic protein FliQ [Oscillospiraceae bacterium]
MSVFYSSLLVVIKIAGPILLASVAIGLIIAIFQAATQIHEQTLTFLPKIVIIGIMMLVLGSTMMATLKDFMKEIFYRITQV